MSKSILQLHVHSDESGTMPVSTEQRLGAGSNGTVNATGGGNMNLTAIMVLCERADDDPYRGFDGRYPTLRYFSCPAMCLLQTWPENVWCPSIVYLPESQTEQLMS